MRALLLALLMLAPSPGGAVEPDEMLDDSALEARAQALDEQLRCVTCRSESIASSNSRWASDARVLVRDLVAEGRGEEEVLAYFRERYGDFVLMRPPAEGSNLILWAAAPAMLLGALAMAAIYLRRRGRVSEAPAPAPLSPEEEARLDDLTGRP